MEYVHDGLFEEAKERRREDGGRRRERAGQKRGRLERSDDTLK